jgi:hypothetical protein
MERIQYTTDLKDLNEVKKEINAKINKEFNNSFIKKCSVIIKPRQEGGYLGNLYVYAQERNANHTRSNPYQVRDIWLTMHVHNNENVNSAIYSSPQFVSHENIMVQLIVFTSTDTEKNTSLVSTALDITKRDDDGNIISKERRGYVNLAIRDYLYSGPNGLNFVISRDFITNQRALEKGLLIYAKGEEEEKLNIEVPEGCEELLDAHLKVLYSK